VYDVEMKWNIGGIIYGKIMRLRSLCWNLFGITGGIKREF
jgi:hypothetical protein